MIDKLYSKYFGSLVRFLSAAFGEGPPPPEDIAQQTFEKLLTLNNIDDIRHPKAFIWKVARNLAISAELSEKASSERESQYIFSHGEVHDFAADYVYIVKEELNNIAEIIQNMPKQRREAFILVRIDGLTHEATAQQLGISRSAVGKHIARAIVEITEALDDD